MPTGYTAALYDGTSQTFPEFAMRCARAFGALVEMRDAPMDAPVPERFAPATCHATELRMAEDRLATVRQWTPAQAAEEARRAYETALAWHRESEERQRARRERYTAMLAEVRAWRPPTPAHDGLKQFMIDQLTMSIAGDCAPLDPPQPQTGEEYRNDAIATARWTIDYHTHKDAEARKQAEECTAWVQALRDSLVEASR